MRGLSGHCLYPDISRTPNLSATGANECQRKTLDIRSRQVVHISMACSVTAEFRGKVKDYGKWQYPYPARTMALREPIGTSQPLGSVRLPILRREPFFTVERQGSFQSQFRL